MKGGGGGFATPKTAPSGSASECSPMRPSAACMAEHNGRRWTEIYKKVQQCSAIKNGRR